MSIVKLFHPSEKREAVVNKGSEEEAKFRAAGFVEDTEEARNPKPPAKAEVAPSKASVKVDTPAKVPSKEVRTETPEE